MSLTCRAIAPESTKPVWNEISRRGQGSTFFHTPVWSEILTDVFPHWVSTPLAMEFSDENAVIIPFLKRSVRFTGFGYAESLLPGVYGGPIFSKTPSVEHWELIWHALAHLTNFVVIGNPFLRWRTLLPFERRSLFTQTLELGTDFDRIKRNFSKGHRANIKTAKNSGLEIDIAQSIEDIRAYYVAYENSLARWGKNAGGFYPFDLFVRLFSHPAYGESIRLWIVRDNKHIIAGGWFFYHNDQATYWHSAVMAEFMNKFPMHLLLDAVIKDACQRDKRWLDFCPSGGLKGVEGFKRGFGAQAIGFWAYRNLDVFGRAFRLYRYMGEHYLRKSFL